MTPHITRMLILGSGPAGLSAAIYGARAGMSMRVIWVVMIGCPAIRWSDLGGLANELNRARDTRAGDRGQRVDFQSHKSADQARTASACTLRPRTRACR